jgi:iron complex outermembrane recepter protein
MFHSTRLLLCSASATAIAFGSPALGQAPGPVPPLPEQCAHITDDAQRQACAEAAEQVDPLANTGHQDTLPTEGPASAEGTQATQEGPRGTIVVTGSRLRRDERSSVDPLTVIDPSTEAREGQFETAEILQSSPLAAGSTQITSAISSNFVVSGGEGVQTVSLRGLGANRTLVLLNGRRAGPAGVRGAVSSFDLNVIPTDAIQSIDILKTGASSIYGSDAIAGVVNLITKKNVQGLEVRGFSSVPVESGGEQYSLSAIYGTQITERGHLMIGADLWRRNELERRDRSFFDCIEENVTNPSGQRVDPIDPRTGRPYCTNIFANAIALVNFSPNFGGGNNLVRNGRAISTIQYDRGNLFQFLDPLDPAANPLQFSAPANIVPVGAYSATALALTNDYDTRVAGDSVIPKTDRFTLFGEAGYELTDTIDLYFEGLFNRRKTRTDASRQLFPTQFTGNSIIPGFGVGLPFFFCDPDEPNCNPFAPGDPLNQEFTGTQLLIPIVRAPFDSSTDVKYYRGVAGARADLGNLLPNGFADFYFQHSRSDGDYQRTIIFRDAIEFGVAEFRTNLCAGTLTAIRGVPCVDIDYTDPRVLAGNFTPQEYDFLFGEDRGNTLYKQNVAELVFGGDIFQLPAGAVKFALGGQWRRDSIRDVPGEHTLADNLWGSTTSGITAGFQRTLEAFGEVEVPLLRDLPLIRELSLNGAARITNTYSERDDGENDSDKGNWTYKIAGNWQTTDWLRLRATYGTSFRSPALFEQFLANESGFLGQGVDPCRLLEQRLAAGEVTQQVFDNCVSQGIPLDHPGVGTSLETFSGGGVGVLDPETSKALTLSAIFTPQAWLWRGGNFSLAVDYIDINVRNQVTQLGVGNILQACYESQAFPDDPLCSLFVRELNPDSPRAFEILTVRNPFININQQHNKSIDVTSRFRQDLGNMGSLSLLGQASFQLKDKFTLFRGVTQSFNGEAGDPKYILDLNVTWSKRPFTVTYGLDVIGPTSNLEDLNESFGNLVTPDNCLDTAAGQALRGGIYCPVYKLPRVAYHSISAEVQATENASFLFGVSNIFDKKPPRVSTVGTPISAFHQVPLLASYYDYFGRRLFVSFRAKLPNF